MQKEHFLSKEIKNYVLNRPNETIYIGFNKLPTTYQKRAFIGFLYQAKNQIFSLKEFKKKFIKEDMIDEYWEDYLKKNIPIFKMDLTLLLKVLNYGKNSKKELINFLQEMKNIKITQIKTQTEIENYRYDGDYVDIPEEELDKIKEVIITNMITYIKVDFEKKEVFFAFSPEINQYLYYSSNYTRMNIFIPSFINSTYAIELYEILLDKFLAHKGLMDKKIKEQNNIIETGWIDLEIFYKKMAIKEDSFLRQFKYFKRELNKWIKKINEVNLIEFEIKDYETKKSGKKVTHLKFYLKERNKLDLIKNNKTLKLEELKEKIKDSNYTFFNFVKDLQKLKNVEITNILPQERGKVLKINNLGLLELDNEELDNAKANLIRRILYQNPSLLGRFEEIDNELEELKNKFINKIAIFKMQNIYYALLIKDIERVDKEDIKVKGKNLLDDKDIEIKFKTDVFITLTFKDELSLADKDYYISLNNQTELKNLEKFYEENKNKFKDFITFIEKKGFDITDELMKIDNQDKKYEQKAKELQFLDALLVKAFEFYENNNLSDMDKKIVLQKFKEFVESENES